MEPEIILKADKIEKFMFNPEKFQVLKDISFTVNKGEFLTLTGKRGSGKSTLLYILSSLDVAYHGKLIVNGKLLDSNPKNEAAGIENAKVGFVSQFQFLLNEFSCLKYVMIPAIRLGRYSKKELEEKAYLKLGMLGLADLALKPSIKLSYGEQYRLAIARALINDPLILICDEPTPGLDAWNKGIVFNVFQQLAHQSGISIISATNDDYYSNKSDRTMKMADGQLICL